MSMSIVDQKIDRQDYENMQRKPGSGPIRIGKKIDVSQDLYSMFFVTNFKSELIYYSKETYGFDFQDGK